MIQQESMVRIADNSGARRRLPRADRGRGRGRAA